MKSYFYPGSVQFLVLKEKLTVKNGRITLSCQLLISWDTVLRCYLRLVSNWIGNSMKKSGSVGCSTYEQEL